MKSMVVQLSKAEIVLLRRGLSCFSISSRDWAASEKLSNKLLHEVEMLDLMNADTPLRQAIPLVYGYKRPASSELPPKPPIGRRIK